MINSTRKNIDAFRFAPISVLKYIFFLQDIVFPDACSMLTATVMCLYPFDLGSSYIIRTTTV